MERFAPDTWRDAVWRPIAMAAPDSGVYMEIMAPDLRFTFLALLTVTIAVLAVLHRRKLLSRPSWLLLAFAWLAFVPWLATSGNGRYFTPVLLLAGPLCIALLHALPLSAAMRLSLAAILVAVQAFVLTQNDPRESWGLAPWQERYFDIELTESDRHEPAAYVLVTLISYSLLAPQFDHRSRWIGLSAVPQGPSTADGRRVQAKIDQAVAEKMPLKLLVPSVPDRTDAQLQPDAVMRGELNRLLKPQRLGLPAQAQCELRRSATLAALMFGAKVHDREPATLRKIGFWICPLAYPVENVTPAAPRLPFDPQLQVRANRIFEVLERQCPRVFGSGAAPVRLEDGGFARQYSDIKAYAMDDGKVYFRYWRALNANFVGTADQVLAPGFRMDCNHINGRSGLPWEREI